MSGNQSPLNMDGFEVLPDTPASISVQLEDFWEARPLKQSFCAQLSERDYEDQSFSHTEKALLVCIEKVVMVLL